MMNRQDTEEYITDWPRSVVGEVYEIGAVGQPPYATAPVDLGGCRAGSKIEHLSANLAVGNRVEFRAMNLGALRDRSDGCLHHDSFRYSFSANHGQIRRWYRRPGLAG